MKHRHTLTMADFAAASEGFCPIPACRCELVVHEDSADCPLCDMKWRVYTEDGELNLLWLNPHPAGALASGLFEMEEA